MKQLCIASNNAGKIREIKALLTDTPIEVYTQEEFSIPPAKENALTFIENALNKARQVCSLTRMPAIADDSGLVVDALNGAPGLYSARYAGTQATDTDNNNKLLLELGALDNPIRTARFVCYLVVLKHLSDPAPWFFQGVWEGEIIDHCKGENGFGYDPLFFVKEFNCTAGELSPEKKLQVSHRAQALQQFKEKLKLYAQ